MESSLLVIFSTSGFITKFNVLRCISLSETLFCSINFKPPAESPLMSAIPALSCQNQIFMTRSYTQYLPKIAQKLKDSG